MSIRNVSMSAIPGGARYDKNKDYANAFYANKAVRR